MRQTALVGLALWLTASIVPAHAEITAASGPAALGKAVPQFSAQLLDDNGAKSAFDSRQTTRPTAYIFVGTTCPATNAYAGRIGALAKTYGEKGVDFIYIFPNRDDSADKVATFHKQKELGGRYITDQATALAQLFGAQKTSELYLADGHGAIVYHGAVDDSRDATTVKQRYLATALDEMLANKAVTTASSDVFA